MGLKLTHCIALKLAQKVSIPTPFFLEKIKKSSIILVIFGQNFHKINKIIKELRVYIERTKLICTTTSSSYFVLGETKDNTENQ